MDITILGTKPEISKTIKQYLGKSKASCLVSSGNTVILVDVGNDIESKLSKDQINKITHVLITHTHTKSIDGLPILDKLLENNNHIVQLYTSFEVAKILKLRYSLNNFEFRILHTGKLFNIGGIFVKPIQVFHAPDYPTFAFSFNGVFLYAPDMGPMVSKKDIKYMRNNLIAVIDGQYWRHQIISDNHITVLNHISYILDLNNKYTLFTGMGNQWPSLKKSNKQLRLKLKEYKKVHNKCTIKEVRTSKEGEKFRIDMRKMIERRNKRRKKIDIFHRK